MGVPQYRCREIPQSRNRQATRGSPKPPSRACSAIAVFASSVGKPLNGPESTTVP